VTPDGDAMPPTVPSAIARLLRSSGPRQGKRGIKHLVWSWKGRRIANPPLPRRVESILFVCLGNICRSPFAEALAFERLRTSGTRPLRVSSAGIRTQQAAEPPPEARMVAAGYGLSLEQHRPRLLTDELMAAHDMVVVMESPQMDLLRQRYPKHADRVFLLSLFDSAAFGLDRYFIVDPFGSPRAAYEGCYQRIDRTVTAMLAGLHEPVDKAR
jgi:protein-tyrosine phosphatase